MKVLPVPPPVSCWLSPARPATIVLSTPGEPAIVALSVSTPITSCGASGL